MSNQFKPGDVVVLKSGGPKMTVESVGNAFGGTERVWCVWFEGIKKMDSDFSPESLKHAG
jgi:uncharacterized protein YodC (DUF2158 family)